MRSLCQNGISENNHDPKPTSHTTQNSTKRSAKAVDPKSTHPFAVGDFAEYYEASSPKVRIFILLLIASCITIATYSITKSVQQYIEQPIQTTVRKVPQRVMSLPSMYICPSNYIDYEKVNDDRLHAIVSEVHQLIRHELYTLIFYTIRSEWRSTLAEAGRNVSQESGKPNPAHMPEITMTSLRQKVLTVAFNQSEIFRDCSVVGNQRVGSCNLSRFEPIVSNRGICYLLRANQFPEQQSSVDGLYLFIDLHALNDRPLDDIDSFATGVSFSFGNEAHPYSPHVYLTGPGRYVKLSMYKEESRLLSQRRKKAERCLEPNEIQTFDYLNLNYSSSACKVDCLMHVEVWRCNCSWDPIDPSLIQPNYRELALCGRNDENCFVYPTNMNKLEHDFYEECVSRCLEPCHTEEYAIHDSSMELGSPLMRLEADIIKKGQKVSTLGDPEYWKTSAVMVHIGFAEMNNWLIEESPSITFIEMISDIGGQVGLWLGASIFGACQVLALLMSKFLLKLQQSKTQDDGCHNDHSHDNK